MRPDGELLMRPHEARWTTGSITHLVDHVIHCGPVDKQRAPLFYLPNTMPSTLRIWALCPDLSPGTP
jgi:hypothetical protein